MKKFNVTGMSCAACQTRVEKAVEKLDGVVGVSVSLLTNSMQVEGEVSDEIIINAVKNAGYGASSVENNASSNSLDTLTDTETPKLRKRLIASIILLIPLMYVSMGHMMWGWPLPNDFAQNSIAIGLYQMLITIIILVINQKFFVNGVKGFINKSPNMDTLVALGSGASFVYSVYVLFVMTNAHMQNDHTKVMELMHDLYFESAAMIVTLITVGKMLEAYSKGKTTNALKGLMKLAPNSAKVIKINENGEETEVEVLLEDIKKDDVFVVKPGDSIPVDGVVIEGISAVDESTLTGESIPIDKQQGDIVSSATINQSGYLKCQATRVGEDTTLSQIIQMVSDAATSKAPIAKVADKVSGVFVPTVLVIAIVTIIIWLLVGESVGFAIARGISVLVISCPCALGLATPVAIMVGNGIGAKNGILFKNASAIENTGKTEIAVFDKTGTITVGKPEVTDVVVARGISENELLESAYAIELKSEHPLAKAIIQYAEKNNVKKHNIIDFKAVIGNGLTGILDGSKIIGGSYNFVSNYVESAENLLAKAEEFSEQGKTSLFFSKDNIILGVIAVADVIKEESEKSIKSLHNMGIRVIMLTGDNEKTAASIGKQIGVDQVIAGVLPEGKEKIIRSLCDNGKTIMVGDGINDAPALTRADIGMAIGAGTDVAIDAADVVLVKNSIEDVPAAIRLSRAVLKNIHENLFWAFIYNIIGIPLAAGIWYPILGVKLNPMFGAAAMSLSSFCVVTNSLRLNLINIYNNSKDKKHKKRKIKIKEENKMEKVMKINGMMCEHCEARVKKVLEALPEVDEAIVSHEENRAIVKLNNKISNDTLKKVIEDEEYVVESIK